MIRHMYPTELHLCKTNFFDTEALFWTLTRTSKTCIISYKMYDHYDFERVNLSFFD